MNKPAVSKAQMKRAIETLEAAGKPVLAVDLLPDGTYRLRLTADNNAPLCGEQAEVDDWDEALGLK